MLYGVLLCTMYMYSVWCTVYSVQCHSVHCTVCAHCTVQCVVSTVQCGKSKKNTRQVWKVYVAGLRYPNDPNEILDFTKQ